jgi:AbrB family looped-hinge helix DNA binding protein
MAGRFQAKITSKGQITLPRQVRDELGVQEGDVVIFEVDADRVQVLPLRKSSPFAHYEGIGNPGIEGGRDGIDSWLRELRGHAPDSD